MEKLNIGIIQGSVREGNNGSKVAEYIYNYAKDNIAANFEIVDLEDYNLPLLGSKYATPEQLETIATWQNKMAEFDGYIFLTPEYNHAVAGGLKNATDFLKPEVANKAAGLVGYGGLGGARAHENMRVILAELSVATVRTTVTFSLMADFKNMSEFTPQDYHKGNIDGMLNELINWSTALKTIR